MISVYLLLDALPMLFGFVGGYSLRVVMMSMGV